MKTRLAFIPVLLVVALVGCGDSNSTADNTETEQLKERIASLEKKLEAKQNPDSAADTEAKGNSTAGKSVESKSESSTAKMSAEEQFTLAQKNLVAAKEKAEAEVAKGEEETPSTTPAPKTVTDTKTEPTTPPPLKTRKELPTLKGHSDWVLSVAFSPDGKRIVSGSYDKTLKIWDAVSGEELQTLKGHRDPVLSVAFSPDGKRVASGSSDLTVRIWDISNLKP